MRLVLRSVMLLAASATARAQMPGAPVLQNAWAAPGIVGAVNVAAGDGSTYAAAASWGSASGRLQLSGGFGVRSRSGAGSKSVYGVRLALPFGRSASAIGFGAFAGVGATSSAAANSPDSVASTTVIPIGVAIGWRVAVGATRGFSVYATPSYVFLTGGDSSTGLVRTAIGVDLGVARNIGITAGVEFGQSHTRTRGGPTGTLYGVGISYAVGRR